MRGFRWRVLGLLLAAGVAPVRGQAQGGDDLAALAGQLRAAWGEQRPAGVVGAATRVLLQLPGQAGSATMGRDQAVRLLSGVFARARELETRVVAAREVEPGQGYVELARRYQVNGAGEERRQRVLLAFRREGAGGAWILVELRVLEGGG